MWLKKQQFFGQSSCPKNPANYRKAQSGIIHLYYSSSESLEEDSEEFHGKQLINLLRKTPIGEWLIITLSPPSASIEPTLKGDVGIYCRM